MSERECDKSRGDLQCDWILPDGDGHLCCRYVIGHEGRHNTAYTTDSSDEKDWHRDSSSVPQQKGEKMPTFEKAKLLDLAARKTAMLAMELAYECLKSSALQQSEHDKAARLRDICYTLLGTKHHGAEPDQTHDVFKGRPFPVESPPAASEERPFEQWWATVNNENTGKLIPKLVAHSAWNAALQSVPSSPSVGKNTGKGRCPHSFSDCGPDTCSFNNEPSDAGQLNDLTETALFDAALKLVCERMQWSVETPSVYVLGWTKAIVEFVKKHN